MLHPQLHRQEGGAVEVGEDFEGRSCGPTAASLQPVHLIAVQSEDGLAKIGKAANIYGAPLAIIVCADRNKAWVRPFDQKQTGDIDASVLTDHMMLQAAELGLGSVWVCCFKPDVLCREFDLPASLESVNIPVIGYAGGKISTCAVAIWLGAAIKQQKYNSHILPSAL